MKKIAIVTFKEHLNNNVFSNDPALDLDGLLEPFRQLRRRLEGLGYDLATYDINPIAEADLIFYFHWDPRLPQPRLENKAKSYFFIFECQIIEPSFYQTELHDYFAAVFTFRDDWIDNKKYFKLNYSFVQPTTINKDLRCKEGFCTLIAGHKFVKHDLELYSERIRAIRWFEKNARQDFDLYGRGWQHFVSPNRWLNKLCQKLPVVRQLIEKFVWSKSTSYRGEVVSKLEVLKKYRFCICYENARDIPGYITEKIWHCLFAGCIPIYWGADNICDYVPANCFIDRQHFANHEELYAFLKQMSDDEYLGYLNNIEQFLNSQLAYKSSASHFVENIISTVINGADLSRNEFT